MKERVTKKNDREIKLDERDRNTSRDRKRRKEGKRGRER